MLGRAQRTVQFAILAYGIQSFRPILRFSLTPLCIVTNVRRFSIADDRVSHILYCLENFPALLKYNIINRMELIANFSIAPHSM